MCKNYGQQIHMKRKTLQKCTWSLSFHILAIVLLAETLESTENTAQTVYLSCYTDTWGSQKSDLWWGFSFYN